MMRSKIVSADHCHVYMIRHVEERPDDMLGVSSVLSFHLENYWYLSVLGFWEVCEQFIQRYGRLGELPNCEANCSN